MGACVYVHVRACVQTCGDTLTSMSLFPLTKSWKAVVTCSLVFVFLKSLLTVPSSIYAGKHAECQRTHRCVILAQVDDGKGGRMEDNSEQTLSWPWGSELYLRSTPTEYWKQKFHVCDHWTAFVLKVNLLFTISQKRCPISPKSTTRRLVGFKFSLDFTEIYHVAD